MEENYFFSLKQYKEQAQKNIDDLYESLKDLNLIVHEKNQVEQIKIDISKHLLEKIKFLLNELISNEDNLLNFASTLRFSFESLIHTKIFFEEPEHVLRLRYFLYSHYKEKYAKLIKRVEEEIELLKEIECFEDQYNKEQWANNKQVSIEELDKVINEKFGAIITMFFEGVKFNGYGYHQVVLQKKVQKIYNDELEKIETNKENFEKDIVRNKYFQEIFGINIQPNQVETKLSDGRSWNEKANLVNLEKEYSLMYDITSSLIHSTSYSLLTNKEMIEQEKKLYFNLLNQYIKQINENIRLYCLLDFFKNENVTQVTLTSDKTQNKHIDFKGVKMNGYCPQCSFVHKEKISMKINSSDYFECPKCNLQIFNSETNKIAAIIPERGNGRIYKDYSSEVWLKNYLLSKAKIDDNVAKPELIFFQTPKELQKYLETIE